MEKKERNLNNTIISTRLSRDEAERYWEIMDDVKKRHPYTNKSAVHRELSGLQKPLVLTAGQIAYYRTGKKQTGGLTLTKSENVRVRIPSETIGGKKPLKQKQSGK